MAQRAIVGFHNDEEDHWVADLECGHSRHVRHQPPWQNRAWVLTEDGRTQFLGTKLECARCGDIDVAVALEPPDGGTDKKLR